MNSNVAHDTTVIDAHAHLVPTSLLESLRHGKRQFPNVELTVDEDSYRLAFNGGEPTRPIAPGLMDGSQRSAWLADNDIGVQIAGGWLDIFGYELAGQEGAEWSEALTTALQQDTAGDRSKVVLGSVPLQEPARAANALRDQRAEGLPGVMIATRAGGRELDDPAMTPFWEAADETAAVIYLHPGFGGSNARYQDFGLVNGLARLEDSTVTLARLLYAGIPARYPSAKILVSHGGAALPYVLGRIVRNHLLHPEATADPVESFSQLYFDSVVFDSDALAFLVGKVGASRVLLGSDYPFPIGDPRPRDVVKAVGLPDDQRALIDGGNARRLFFGRIE